MRPGHNSSSGSEEWFESTIDLQLSLLTVEQSQLVDEHRPKSKARGVDPALCGNLLVYIEDALEVFVEVLVGQATQLVKNSPHLYSGIGVRVSATFGGDQKPLRLLADLAYVLGVVMGVSQHEARLFRQRLDQRRGYLVVGGVGGGEPGRKRDPHRRDRYGQVQLPPIDPPVPAALGPTCLGVYGSVRYDAGFLVFLVPHSPAGAKRGGVKSHRSARSLPRLKKGKQVTSQAADLSWQPLGQSTQPALKGAPRRKAPSLTQKLAHLPDLLGRFLQHSEQFAHFM